MALGVSRKKRTLTHTRLGLEYMDLRMLRGQYTWLPPFQGLMNQVTVLPSLRSFPIKGEDDCRCCPHRQALMAVFLLTLRAWAIWS